VAAPAGPPPGASGLPEIALADLAAPLARAAILDRGGLLVRGAVDAGRAEVLRDSIDEAFAAREAAVASRAERSSCWYPLRLDPDAAAGLARPWIRTSGGVLLADSPRVMFEVLHLYEQMGLRRVVSDYLGIRPVISANKCTLRRVALDAVGSWHQDGAFLGSRVRALNLWLALTPCGVDAPGLELVPRRFDDVIETGTAGSYFDWAAGDSVVNEASGGVGVVRPSFEAGDLLLFDELFLHRTFVDDHMTIERHAIETWCFAPTSYPDGHVPLVW
jgi:hypothetical protein